MEKDPADDEGGDRRRLPPPSPVHRMRPAPGLLEAADLTLEANTEAPGKRPRIDYLATGGTIASVRRSGIVGAAPALTAADIAASTVGLDQVADVHTSQFLQQASPSITIGDLLRLRDEMAARVVDGSRGLVITQGTDSIEETAFVLDLLWQHDAPVVVTGAMRTPCAPGGDGPGNLLAAVQVAASQAARGVGVLVVFNDEIHAARFVHKGHTSSLAAFGSPLAGPIGWVSEGRPVLVTRPAGRAHLDLTAGLTAAADIPPVALLRLGLGDDGRLLPALAGLGYRGAVIDGFGGGHVTPAMVPLVERLATQMPVVLASRAGAGEVLTETYRYPGSEIELMALGVIRAGALDGLKARLLLTLCLAAGQSPGDIAAAFARVAMTTGPITADGEPHPLTLTCARASHRPGGVS